MIASAGSLSVDCHEEPRWQQIQMNSALLLEWAPHILTLHLWADSYEIPGLPEFVQAASSLEHIDFKCDSLMAAAQIGHLLPSVSSEVAIQMRGSHTPGAWPVHLHTLHVEFLVGWEAHKPSSWDPSIPSALLYSIARLEHLESLQLVMDHEPACMLSCPFRLPELFVSVHLILDVNTVIDLSWLQHQPCDPLSLVITVFTVLPSQHQHLVDQLLRLPLHRLDVHWRSSFPSRLLQMMWQRISVRDRFLLDLQSGAPAGVLQALPGCSRIKVWAVAFDLVPDWKAVSNQAAHFSFHMGKACLRIIGSGHVPHDLEGAWQLSVDTDSSVYSLQGGCVQGSVHCLQNAAAVSAGWPLNDAD